MALVPNPPRSSAVEEFLKNLPARQLSRSHGTGAGRLIFALDATASREPTWDRAAMLQSEMFDAVAGIGRLDVQLVYFRGIDECRASRWLTSAAALHGLMQRVRCAAGET